MLNPSHKVNRDLLTKMSSIRNTDGGLVVQRSYTYDKLGRPVTRQTLRSGGAMNETFNYNDRSESARRLAGRLDKSAAFAPKGRCRVNSPTLHSLGEAPHAYAYDNIGNRITAQEDAESVTYEANNLNQYTQIDTDGTAFVPEYDEDGNQTRVRTSTGIWKVQYNAQNRAIRYESEADSTHVITCVYDSQGRRVEKKEEKEGAAISHVRYVYRGYLQVAAYDLLAEGLPSLWQIIWDPTQEIATRPLVIRANGAYSTYGWDLTKNICETYAGATGFLVHRYAYSPYGLVSIEGDTSYQPIQWSSEVYDAELGLVYYNYRYYNPLDGRWTRRDLLPEVRVCNLYEFTLNAPISQNDILGLVSYSLKGCTLHVTIKWKLNFKPENVWNESQMKEWEFQAKELVESYYNAPRMFRCVSTDKKCCMCRYGINAKVEIDMVKYGADFEVEVQYISRRSSVTGGGAEGMEVLNLIEKIFNQLNIRVKTKMKRLNKRP